MKTRDLFSGCFVTIGLHNGAWAVALHTVDQKRVLMNTYTELPDALEAVHKWTRMMSDDAEISPNAESAADLMRETLARAALGEAVGPPETVEEVEKPEDLRSWFEREMGISRNEEE